MKQSKLGGALRFLGLILALSLTAHLEASFGFWLARPTGRCNPNDPANPTYGNNKLAEPAALKPTPTATPVPCRPQPVPAQVVLSNNAFALNLFSNLLQQYGPSNNLTFSPFSVSTALAMTWAGAEGQTASQMADVLQYPDDSNTVGSQYLQLQDSLSQTAAAAGVTLTVANSLWLNDLVTFSPSYLSFVQQDYLASVTSMSFADPTAAAAQINAWVNQETDQMIPSILAPGDVDPQNSVAFLLNAILLMAKWQYPFTASSTQNQAFDCADGSVTSTPMMNQEGYFYYLQAPDAQVLELPYAGGSLSMLAVLPAQGTSLASLEAGLSATELNGWVEGLCDAYVSVSIPKLNLSFGTVDLAPNLQALGMTDAFVKGTADFSGMVPNASGMFIQFVKHKAVVQVDEAGIKAAAVTAVGVGTAAIAIQRPLPVVFDADRPFLFLVRDRNTGAILFMGSVTNPNLN